VEHILTERLQVTERDFWECVSHGERPDRGSGEGEVPPNALPAGRVYQLINTAAISEDEVAGMTVERATEIVLGSWSRPKD
jgi:hypothetical protein